MAEDFDETKLNELIGKVIGDVAGALSLFLSYIGDQAGVFAALDGAARHIRSTLSPGGTFMLVEPLAGDAMADNISPIGQILYAFSTTVCTPASLAQEIGLGPGAQAGEKRLTAVLNETGFISVRRASETPTNMVLEVTG